MGVLPSNGVPPADTTGGRNDLDLTGGCAPALFYPPRCNPRMDPFAMNALISEFVHGLNCLGLTYDCTDTDNFCNALIGLVQNEFNYGIAAGTATALTLALSPDIADAYKQGFDVYFKALSDSGGAPATLNVNGLGPKSIVPLTALKAGKVYHAVYNGTAWQLLGVDSTDQAKTNLTRMQCIRQPPSPVLVPTGIITTLPITSFTDDGQADFSIAGNIVTCQRAGRYNIFSSFAVNTGATTSALTQGLMLNGATQLQAASLRLDPGSSVRQLYGGAAEVADLLVGDTFFIWAYHEAAGAANLEVSNRVTFQRLTAA